MALNPIKTADDLRTSAWGDRGIPVDPVTIAHALGVHVVEASLPKEISGALLKYKGQDAQIIVHDGDSDNRKRFTVAHELGHYVDRTQKGDDFFEYLDFRSPESSNGDNADEIFANQFAANLLMPASEVKSLFKNHKSAAVLASLFGVSSDAMSYRLLNLKLIANEPRVAAGC